MSLLDGMTKKISRSFSNCDNRRLRDRELEKTGRGYSYELVKTADEMAKSNAEGVDSKETTDSPANRRNVYVCGHIMAAKNGAKPIGSIKKRSHLTMRRARLTDLAVIFAIGGLILAIIDTELLEGREVKEGHYVSIILRSLVILATVILLVLIICYHAVEAKITLLDSSTRDYCVVLTLRRLVQCVLELSVCCICPVPAYVRVPYARVANGRRTRVVQVQLGGILTAAMFLRLYLLCRMIAFHSRQFRDSATRTVASLSRISVNFAFVMKTLMVEYPLTVLLVVWILFAFSISWLFAQCERLGAGDDSTPGYLNSMWFIMVTLAANGYGDVVPKTYCGRSLAIIASLAGIGITSSLIAVMKAKLQMTQAERRVNEFVKDSKLTAEKKNAAATVLQHTWYIHKYTSGVADDGKLRAHQRRFLNAINHFRRIKYEQRLIFDDGYNLPEITHIQKSLKHMMCDLKNRHLHATHLVCFISQQLEQLEFLVAQWQLARVLQFEKSQKQHQQSLSSVPSVNSIDDQSKKTNQPFRATLSVESEPAASSRSKIFEVGDWAI